ncbi:methyl-accepting chemotaxis protein [Alkalimonas amylolytica]|uniref:Methyl-accepting chemotaxis sensory transducer with Cache sensor n=1 Tax=Alkalimonas amylolytica TaxID=152573 RepID=A0A1H4EKM3_ALKAM|nr:methyl-accepting chemotaxis protein [Alkalimonas amylolytica]SEA84802.1 methyl-accepting chemotaxis sensory transducer with Cache sensor [Alkalimonas amylolytica]
MNFFSTVAGRLLTIPLVALIGFLLLATVALNALNTSLMQGREARVMAIIEAGLHLVQHYQQLEASGELTTEQAQQQALQAIQAIRYDGTEYIWINDMGRPIPRMIMHPTAPRLDGTILDERNFHYATQMRSKDGRQSQRLDNANLFVSFVDAVNRYGSGFVEYQWPKPLAGGGLTEERYTKLSFVDRDPQWGWVLGSGIYIDDVQAAFWAVAARIALVVVLIIAITVGLSLYIRQWLLSQLGGEVASARALVRQVAGGDFRADFALKPGDNSSLLAALSGLVQRLREIISQQTEMAEQLAEQSAMLDDTSQQTQHILQSVMDQTAQVATAVSEMTATCEDMARNAATAAQSARDADQQTRSGTKAVEDTILAIEALKQKIEQVGTVIQQLSKRSEEVGAVTDVIGNIAEQTNLLALNAAIEAARAGEMGRGFAVVADEVRTLASRSQESTQGINQRIQDIQHDSEQAVQSMASSQQETEQTIERSQQAGKTLAKINQAVSSITDVNDQLASATEELATVSATINENMEHIANAVQDTTAKSNELTGASQQLRSMAARMKTSLQGFKL